MNTVTCEGCGKTFGLDGLRLDARGWGYDVGLSCACGASSWTFLADDQDRWGFFQVA